MGEQKGEEGWPINCEGVTAFFFSFLRHCLLAVQLNDNKRLVGEQGNEKLRL